MKIDFNDKYPNWLTIKDSNIQNSWKGVFSNIYIKKWVVLWEYIWKITDPKLFDNKHSHTQYWFSVRSWSKVIFVIDAASKKFANWTRYINCAWDKTLVNVKFFQHKQRIYVKTLIDIFPNDEILVWYWYEYWEKVLWYNIYNK